MLTAVGAATTLGAMHDTEDVPARWLSAPGRPGAVGALMDEYARAAEDLCRHVEAVDAARLAAPWSTGGEFATPLDMLRHVLRAAFYYASDLRKAAGLPALELPVRQGDHQDVSAPDHLRPRLRAALDATVAACEPMAGESDDQLGERTFVVAWGVTYDPDMLLEHAVMHLYRHRRQLVRGLA